VELAGDVAVHDVSDSKSTPTDWEDPTTSARMHNLTMHIVFNKDTVSDTVYISDISFANEMVVRLTRQQGDVATARAASFMKISIQLIQGNIQVAKTSDYFLGPYRWTPQTQMSQPNFATWLHGITRAKLLDPSKPVNVLEIGSWEGRSAAFWMEHLASLHPDSRIVVVDPCAYFEVQSFYRDSCFYWLQLI
jgi:hypothetical protein